MAGIASFVNGFVSGVNQRHAWEDRKLALKQQQEDRDWEKIQRQWETEDRAYTLEERQRKRAAEDKALAEKQAEEDALRSAFSPDGSTDGANAVGSSPTSYGPTAQGPARSVMDGEPSTGVSLVFSGVPAIDPDTGAPAQQQASPMLQQVPTGGRSVQVQDGGGSVPVRSSAPEGISGEAYQAAPRVIYYDQPATPSKVVTEPVVNDLPRADASGKLRTQSIGPAGMPGSPGTRSVVYPTQPVPIYRAAPAQAPSTAQSVQPRYVPPPADTPRAAAASMPQPRSVASAVAASDPATATAPGGDPAAAPSVQIAAATTPPVKGAGSDTPRLRFSFGVNNPVTVTPENADKSVKSFMANYLDKGVPKMVQFYLQHGQPEKAKAFADWAADADTQASIEEWSRGVHAAAVGDTDGMLDSMTRYYNRMDPNVEVIRSESGMIKDEKGNIVGMDVTFRNRRTGEKFTKTFHGSEDMVRNGIMALAPEKMFELMYQQDQTVQRALLEAQQKGGANPADQTKRLNAAMTMLAQTDLSYAALSPEDKVKKAWELIQAQDAQIAAANGYPNAMLAGDGSDIPLDLPPTE
jgi:hypothetical protein